MASNPKYKWHKRIRETPRAFAAFQCYLDLGPERNHRDAYRQAYGNPKARQCPGWFSEWTKKYDWKGRTAAYDAHLANIRERAEEKAVADESAKWAQRQEQRRHEAWDMAQELLEKARLMLKMPLTIQEKKEETEVREEVDPETGEVKSVIIRNDITVIKPVKWLMKDVSGFLEVVEKLRKVALEEDDTQRIDLRIVVERHLDKLRGQGFDVDSIDAAEIAQLALELADDEIENTRH